MRELQVGDPIVYEDEYYICRWGKVVTGPVSHPDFKFPVIKIQLPSELPKWVPVSQVQLARTRELPYWARREAA